MLKVKAKSSNQEPHKKKKTNTLFLPYCPHFLLKDKPQTSLAKSQSSNCSLSLTPCPSHDLFCPDSSQHLLPSPPQCPGDQLYHQKRTCSKAAFLNASPGLPEDDPAHEEKAGRFVTVLPLLVTVSWRARKRTLGATLLLLGEGMGGNSPARQPGPSPAPGKQSTSLPFPPLLDASRLWPWK